MIISIHLKIVISFTLCKKANVLELRVIHQDFTIFPKIIQILLRPNEDELKMPSTK